MFEDLINLIIKALKNMVGQGDVDLVKDYNIKTVSEEMSKSVELWKDMYKDVSPWLNYEEGIISTGIAKDICEVIKTTMLNEFKLTVYDKDGNSAEDLDENSFIYFFNNCIQNQLIKKLGDSVDEGLGLGGFIVKPYINNGKLYFDFIMQGDFYPIQFDDDGNIIDIAFIDQFISGNFMYTKVERQKFENNVVYITNKAYKSKLVDKKDTDKPKYTLGDEIPLAAIEKWKDVEPEAELTSTNKALYGYFRAAGKNNIDTKSALGMSCYGKAAGLIMKADFQFCRLDWEYEGGQLAVDVDPTAIESEKCRPNGYWENTKAKIKDLISNEQCSNKQLTVANGRRRLYRAIDRGTDETYEVFAPNLRDGNYLAGYDRYLTMIEDRVSIARGSLGGNMPTEARTATEIKVLNQRAFNKAKENQENLQNCLEDVIYAAWVFCINFREQLSIPTPEINQNEENKIINDTSYTISCDFGDSVLTDKDTQLQQELALCDKNILSKAEVRSTYTGEDEEVAQQKIDEIVSKNQENMLNDIFAPGLEGADENEKENENDKQAGRSSEKTTGSEE